MCAEITYTFPNFNGACEYISKLGFKWIHVNKKGSWPFCAKKSPMRLLDRAQLFSTLKRILIFGVVRAKSVWSMKWKEFHDDVMTRRRFPRYRPFVKQKESTSVSLLSALTICWTNSQITGDLGRRNSCDVTVMRHSQGVTAMHIYTV